MLALGVNGEDLCVPHSKELIMGAVDATGLDFGSFTTSEAANLLLMCDELREQGICAELSGGMQVPDSHSTNVDRPTKPPPNKVSNKSDEEGTCSPGSDNYIKYRACAKGPFTVDEMNSKTHNPNGSARPDADEVQKAAFVPGDEVQKEACKSTKRHAFLPASDVEARGRVDRHLSADRLCRVAYDPEAGAQPFCRADLNKSAEWEIHYWDEATGMPTVRKVEENPIEGPRGRGPEDKVEEKVEDVDKVEDMQVPDSHSTNVAADSGPNPAGPTPTSAAVQPPPPPVESSGEKIPGGSIDKKTNSDNNKGNNSDAKGRGGEGKGPAPVREGRGSAYPVRATTKEWEEEHSEEAPDLERGRKQRSKVGDLQKLVIDLSNAFASLKDQLPSGSRSAASKSKDLLEDMLREVAKLETSVAELEKAGGD
eukprot:g10522.t1